MVRSPVSQLVKRDREKGIGLREKERSWDRGYYSIEQINISSVKAHLSPALRGATTASRCPPIHTHHQYASCMFEGDTYIDLATSNSRSVFATSIRSQIPHRFYQPSFFLQPLCLNQVCFLRNPQDPRIGASGSNPVIAKQYLHAHFPHKKYKSKDSEEEWCKKALGIGECRLSLQTGCHS